jgi:hypothetical protein
VADYVDSAGSSGVADTPTFVINGRRQHALTTSPPSPRRSRRRRLRRSSTCRIVPGQVDMQARPVKPSRMAQWITNMNISDHYELISTMLLIGALDHLVHACEPLVTVARRTGARCQLVGQSCGRGQQRQRSHKHAETTRRAPRNVRRSLRNAAAVAPADPSRGSQSAAPAQTPLRTPVASPRRTTPPPLAHVRRRSWGCPECDDPRGSGWVERVASAKVTTRGPALGGDRPIRC